ncbi:LacI family DNA-binding transcriptional regulator [Williamsia maris]|uniref:Transcriptional regulator, LacI family n=1 Tax=Williamsia maris TaxID=72806 RepID=A0ABT1HGY3_9NOCA|nr:LacI family DNA-binding transcriptional regulator [Williamsia maris]MCP2177507.1 transcriptional regulator, LacI family [Williamsia maris]
MSSGSASGRKAVTMQDIADRVGVSKALVSLVLRHAPGPSDQTRTKVLAAAAELKYRPDRAAALLSARRSHMIGVVADVRNAFHAEMVEHLIARADAVGYEVVLGPVTPTHPEDRVVDTLIDFRCEAMVLLGSELPAERLADLAADVPTVVVGRRVTVPGVDVVRVDDNRGVRVAIDHLVDLGHRHIAHLSGGGQIAADRRRGYERAMRRHGLGEKMVVYDGDFTEVSGAHIGETLLARTPEITAVLAGNDRIAIGFLETLWRAGVPVPERVSVVGYDDSTIARWAHIDLTSVGQAASDQAHSAIDAVVARLDDGPARPAVTVFAPRLVVRGTTAAPS